MKAVVMAGGEGSRLRPLTCTIPKPMARIFGRPMIEYAFELLRCHGVDEAAVTLGYLPHVIEDAYRDGYKNMRLRFVREDEPLGTAGGVRNAAVGFNEPFVVISADALCDFDIGKIVDYHKASGAKITIVATEAQDPREYGLVKVDKSGRVLGFIEKPSWQQAVSSLANTGVYIIDPSCLELIPRGRPYDFAKDLFPLMLERDMPIYCYRTADYWCDVGSIESYMKCQRDIFGGSMRMPLSQSADGIYAEDGLPGGDYSLIPPVYIGSSAEIGDGAVIGPYAVIDKDCTVGANSKIRYSTVLENCWIAADSSVTGALICSGAALKRGAAMFEHSVAGSGSVIGEDACVRPNVLVWPGKIVGGGATVSSNVKYGSTRSNRLGERGLDGSCGARLNALTCARLGSAVGSTHGGRRTGVAHDGSKTAAAMHGAVVAGLLGSGAAVWDFGECFEAQLDFLVNFCGLGAGLFIVGGDSREIVICGEGGLSITRSFERSIEAALARDEFREISEKDMHEAADMTGVKLLYRQELMKQAPYGLDGISVTFESENSAISSIMGDVLGRLGAAAGGDTVLRCGASGAKLSAYSPESGEAGYDRLLALCCLGELEKGRDIAVAYDAPMFLDSLAAEYGRKVFRYLGTPADNSDSSARRLASKQIFVRDGLFLAVKLLSMMKEKERSLGSLLADLPEKAIVRKRVRIGFSPAELAGILGGEGSGGSNNFEGIRLTRSGGKLLVTPERSGGGVRILAEADSAEAAQELCAGIEELLTAEEQTVN